MNEHRQNSSQKNYLSKNFIRKPIILSLKAIRVILTGSWIISRPFHASKSGRRHQMSTPKSVSTESYKTSMTQLYTLKSPFKKGISLTINVQIVPEDL